MWWPRSSLADAHPSVDAGPVNKFIRGVAV